VNAADYTLWRDNYAPPAIGSTAPEPASSLLVTMALALVLTHFRHRAGSTPSFHNT
jgi:hypothetical protein